MLETIIAGDTLEIVYSDSDYSTSTYDIRISLRGEAVPVINIDNTDTNITIVKSGYTFTVTVPASVTAGWTAGDYKYAIYMYTATLRYQVETGTVTVKPDLYAKTSTYDSRSHVKVVLDAIEAVIEGRASTDQMSYSIAGRTLAKMPIKDLLYLRDRYRAEYKREQDAEKIAMGETIGGQVRVKL
jgi:hypothetical protein